jgi:excisionase family DNA binding protein
VPPIDPLLTIREAARQAHVSESTLRRRIRDGEVPAIRVGSNRKAPLRLDPGEFDTWLRSTRATT